LADPVLLAKAAAAVLRDERTRKAAGWVLVALLSPIILLIAFLCCLGAGAAENNVSAVELCFNGGTVPANASTEYRVHLEKMRNALSLLDETVTEINGQTEGETSLDATRVKAIFYALYFGAESCGDAQTFADCFVTYEERTRTVPVEGSDPPAETEEIYCAAIPIEDMETVWQNIHAAMGVEATAEQRGNADSVYNLIRYGAAAGGSGFAGSDVPFIGADGFCSPVGENWRNIVTSEFGNRRDPFTGERRGHTGMDLAVPTGTSVRAALRGR